MVDMLMGVVVVFSLVRFSSCCICSVCVLGWVVSCDMIWVVSIVVFCNIFLVLLVNGCEFCWI